MNGFLIYQGKVAIIMAVFYLFYRLILSRETLHRLNRAVLLATAALSFVLPFCVITIRKAEMFPRWLLPGNALTDGAAQAVAGEFPAFPGVRYLWIAASVIYMLVAFFLIFKTIIAIVRTKAIVASGNRRTIDGGIVLSIVDDDISPFSWMKYIVIPKCDYEDGYFYILSHERAHVALHHSLDVLFVDLVAALQWFNPAVWMLRSELRAIHEYEADAAVLKSGSDIRDYQYLLIRKAVGRSTCPVVNSFNHSILGNRIATMSKPRSPMRRGLRAFYIVPLLAVVLCCNSRTVSESKVAGDSEEVAADCLMTAEEFPEWIMYNVRCPKGFSGKVSMRVSFTIDENGKVADLQCHDCNNERLKEACLTAFAHSPKWSSEWIGKTLICPVTFAA